MKGSDWRNSFTVLTWVVAASIALILWAFFTGLFDTLAAIGLVVAFILLLSAGAR